MIQRPPVVIARTVNESKGIFAHLYCPHRDPYPYGDMNSTICQSIEKDGANKAIITRKTIAVTNL